MEPSEIRLKLQKRSKTGTGYVPVDIIGNYLIRMQNLVNHCGEYLSEKPFRTQGKTSSDIQKKCRLLMKDAEISSFDQCLVLEDSQSVLFGNKLGVEAIGLSADLLNSVGKKDTDEIHKKIDNSRYRNRLIKDLNAMIPGRGEGVDLIVNTMDTDKITLRYENKAFLKQILKSTKNEDIELIGILSEMRVTQGLKKVELTSPEGKIKIRYPKDKMNDLIEVMKKGQPIKITGIAKIREDDTIEILEKIHDIREIRSISRHRIVLKDFDMKLRNPLDLNLEYKDDQWIMKNEELGIFSQNKDYKLCLKEAENEFAFIYGEYVDAPDNELTNDALKLKSLLISMISEN